MKTTHTVGQNIFSKLLVTITLLHLFVTVEKLQAQPYYYCFGNIHSHSSYSDGNQANNPAFNTPADCFNYANASLNVNYWGISDHNHSAAGMQLANYRKGIRQADSLNTDPNFITMYGMEYGVISTGGHVIIYGIDSLVGWETNNYQIYNGQNDYASLFNMVASRTNAYAYLAHMDSVDYSNIVNLPYNAVWDSALAGISLRNGPAFSTDTNYTNPSTSSYLARYQDLLRRGYHVAPGIDQDNHYITFGRTSEARTVVLSDSLTRSSLYRAIRRSRFYASDDFNATLDFKINNQVMGSILQGNTNPQISASLTDLNGENVSSIRLLYGIPGGTTNATTLQIFSNTNTMNFTHIMPINTSYYYYLEITQQDGDKIWSAPIWYTKTSATTLEEIEEKNFFYLTSMQNPVVNTTHLILSSDKEESVQIMITNLSGQIILNTSVISKVGNVEIPIACEGWNSGIYLVHAKGLKSGKSFAMRLVKN